MRFIIKLSISVAMILLCTQIGRKMPTLAGLLAVMPLTGLIVLLWLYSDNPGNFDIMTEYVKGALWGIIPSILFFAVAFVCFRRHLSIWIVLAASFTIWLSLVGFSVSVLVVGIVIHPRLTRFWSEAMNCSGSISNAAGRTSSVFWTV